MAMRLLHILMFTFLPTVLFSSKVVTGFDCEITSTNDPDWGSTTYGKDGGTDGGWGKDDGRLFQFDCQTDHCYDSEGERNDYWVTCGYSWEDSDDLDDSDDVIVDVRTEAFDNIGKCRSGYTSAMRLDATGNAAKDTSGNWGWHGFHICYETETWSTVKKDRLDVVTDLYCGASKSNRGWRFLGQWDTHDNGKAMGYGDGKRTPHELYLWSRNSEVSLPVKTIGYWEAETRSRTKSTQTVKVRKRAFQSGSVMTSDSQMNSWSRRISKSHDAEVSANVKGLVKAMKMTAGARYNYKSTEEHSESFHSYASRVAKQTFEQEIEVEREYTIPAQAPGEPIHSNIWFFRTQVIDQDLSYADMTLFTEQSGFEVDGYCYNVAPNCLPDFCDPFDPHCWTCTQDWAKIDPDFLPPDWCDGCPAGFKLVFDTPDGECQQTPNNDGEYTSFSGETLDSCASRCAADSSCYAFDFKHGGCYLNSRCDKQEKGDGYIACRKDDGCPSGFELTFPGKPDGECQQTTANDGEYGNTSGETLDSCASRCAADANCYAIDFKGGDCYLNTRCDKQEEGDGYRSCKKKHSTVESESAVSKMKVENKKLQDANKALRKALEALAK